MNIKTELEAMHNILVSAQNTQDTADCIAYLRELITNANDVIRSLSKDENHENIPIAHS